MIITPCLREGIEVEAAVLYFGPGRFTFSCLCGCRTQVNTNPDDDITLRLYVEDSLNSAAGRVNRTTNMAQALQLINGAVGELYSSSIGQFDQDALVSFLAHFETYGEGAPRLRLRDLFAPLFDTDERHLVRGFSVYCETAGERVAVPMVSPISLAGISFPENVGNFRTNPDPDGVHWLSKDRATGGSKRKTA